MGNNQTKIAYNRWTDILVHRNNRTLFSNKKQSSFEETEMLNVYYGEACPQRRRTGSLQLNDTLQRPAHGESKKTSGCWGWGSGGAVKTPCGTLQWNRDTVERIDQHFQNGHHGEWLQHKPQDTTAYQEWFGFHKGTAPGQEITNIGN